MLILFTAASIIVWSVLSALRGRLLLLEDRMTATADLQRDVAALARRVLALEGQRDDGTQPIVVPTATAALALEMTPVADSPVAARTRLVPVGVVEPAPTLPDHGPVVSGAAPETQADVALPVTVTEPPSSESAAPGVPSGEAWEVVVGTSWLNKIGVFTSVTGLALLLGYSMAHIGPLGRVILGFAVSGAMLAVGATFERRPVYRHFGYGLIAGGWAGAYVTAFAMRGIPAARVLESDGAGLAALLLVASGMVAHSLRYRSETLTALAYTAAYLPLAFTPLATFPLLASIPLVASLLVVAQRFGWSTVSLMGLASTYLLFALRGRLLPGEIPDPAGFVAYGFLATYWLTFEVADIATLRLAGAAARRPPSPLLAANAIGHLGALLMMSTEKSGGRLALVLAATGVAHLVSAAIRSRIIGSAAGRDAGASSPFTTAHASMALAAGTMVWSIDLRMSGPRETLALLLAAELLMAVGLTLADRHVRRIGTAVALLVSAHATGLALSPGWGLAPSTLILTLVAIVWYANHEWLRVRQVVLDPVEHLFPWTALLFLGMVVSTEVAPVYRGLVGIGAAVALLEAGRRERPGYTFQSYVSMVVASVAVLLTFMTRAESPTATETWAVLTTSAGLAYAYARRSRIPDAAVESAGSIAAALAGCAGTAFILILEWRQAPEAWLGPVWIATALSLVALGSWRAASGLRWQGYATALLSLAHVGRWASTHLQESDGPGVAPLLVPASVVAVYAASYVLTFLGRTVPASTDKPTLAQELEQLVVRLLPAATTWLVAVFEWQWIGQPGVGAAYAVTAGALLIWGLSARAIDIRLQSFALSAAGATTTLTAIVAESPPSSAFWGGVTIAVFYATTLAAREPLRTRAREAPGRFARAEEWMRVALSGAATLLLLVLVGVEAPATWITVGWGLQGMLLLVAGFLARERALRVAGLGVLLLCILKLFVYDLRELDAIARILSFVTLGLLLLGVSWTYTRYKGEFRKFL